MSPADQAEFLKGLGLPDRALDRLLRAAYDLLGLVSFLTTGEDECRAWSIPRGTHAVKARRRHPHRLRADVMPRRGRSVREAGGGGSLAACRAHGSFRLEGKGLRRPGRRRDHFRVGAQ